MTVEDKGVVDFVVIHPKGDKAYLVLCDHLPWEEDSGDLQDRVPPAEYEETHLRLLQEKIYIYLDAMESREIYEAYPPCNGLPLEIMITALHPLSARAQEFFGKISDYVRSLGFDLLFHLSSDKYPFED
jgi:hypothetical protein